MPDNPGAWLMATAKNRAIDRLRRKKMAERKHAEIGREMEEGLDPTPHIEAALDDDIGDDLLRLVFTACHPVLTTEARVALTLRLLGGLTTDEIARAFLVPEPTMAQRIVRAKRTLADANVGFEAPRGEELAPRLASVLEVIYLIFNEGYTATAGEHWTRPQLCEEALRLGRILAGLAPNEPEVHGLVALMEIQASRLAARAGPDGEPILLMDQNRTRWDHVAIRRGLAALARAEALGPPGPYALQAAIAACHARAATAEDTDWARIAALYQRAGRDPALAGGRAQPGGGGRHGGGAGGRACHPRRHRRRAGDEGLSPAAGGARRHAGEARAWRRSARRVRARRGDDPQRARARGDAEAGGGLRSVSMEAKSGQGAGGQLSGREATIRRVFRISLILKAIDSVIEMAGGVVLYLIPSGAIVALANWLTRSELLEDPRDFLANMVMHSARGAVGVAEGGGGDLSDLATAPSSCSW